MSEVEIHKATKHGENYYGFDGRAATMMRTANFPDEVVSFFQLEAVATLHAVQCYGCDTIVELGCYDGRSIELSRSLNLRYVGVDLDTEAIECLRNRIAAEGMEDRAEALVANVLDLEHWAGRIRGHRTLIHLPFNFLGGFRAPSTLLELLCQIPEAILLISVFNTSEYSTYVRHRYYTTCGVKSLRMTSGAGGSVIFSGDRHFFSQAFTTDMLYNMFKTCRIDPLFQKSNQLSTCMVVKPRDLRENCS